MAGWYPTEPYTKRTWGVEEPDYDTYSATDAYDRGSYRNRTSVGTSTGLHFRSRPSSAGSGGGRDRASGRLDSLYNGGLTTPAGVGAADHFGNHDPRTLVRTPHSNFGADEYMPTRTDHLFKDDPALAYANANANIGKELTLHPNANAKGYDQYSLYDPAKEVAQYNFEGRFERKLQGRREMAKRGYRLSFASPWWTFGPWTDPDDTESSKRSDTIRFGVKTLSMVLVFLSMWLQNAFFTVAALILLGSDVPRRIRQNMSAKMKAPFEEFHPVDVVPEAVFSFLMAWWFDTWMTYILVVCVAVLATASLIQIYWIIVEYWMVPGHIRYYGRKIHREASFENFTPLALTLGSRMAYHAREGCAIIYRRVKSFFRSAWESIVGRSHSQRSPEPSRRRGSVQQDRVPYGARAAPGGRDYSKDGRADRREMTPTPNRNTDAARDSSVSSPRTSERPRSGRSGKKKPAFAVNLVAEDIRTLKRFLSGDPTGPRERLLGSITISHRLIQEMKPGDLVEDSIIDGFVELLKIRNHASQRRRDRVPKCMFLPTRVFEFLKADGGASQAWKCIEQADNRGEIFSYDRVFIPVNADERHWTIVEIDFQRKCLHYYDSAGESEDTRVVNAINGLLVWGAKKKRIKLSELQTDFLSSRDVPMQRNDFDCGIFIILYMILRSENLPVDFDPLQVSNFRARIALNLINGALESNL